MRWLLIGSMLAAVLAFGCGAGVQPDTWTLPVKSAQSASASATARRECGAPIKVAVVPFRDARPPTDVSMGVIPWIMLGMLASPDFEDVTTYGPRDPGRPQDYVHDDERIFAAVLQRELENTGCFDVVAFDPRFQEAYDVVLGGKIVNAGKRIEAPFVPLPAWIGTITASALGSRGYVVEAELWASAPGAEPFLRYGVQGACAGSECGSSIVGRASGLAAALTSGYAPFVHDFRDYVASRTPFFWRRVGDARFMRFARKRDAELDALVAAVRRNDRCRDVYEEELTKRTGSLAAMFDESSREETQWAARSWERADEEVRKSNEAAAAAFTARQAEVGRLEASRRRSDAESDLAGARERDHGDGFLGALFGVVDTSIKASTARNARAEEEEARARENRLVERVRQQMAQANQAVADLRGEHAGTEERLRAWASYYASQRRPLDSLAERCR
ncbi:hypothetical protein AKJ09_02636 [Labilithrix luteola]|uniref:Lipoprotein n=1 Tax=Labilithrix luteola TaxID=1391654 RepID=A0A0K1PR22_9BACT|nr:hypothetical protein [Labilithrix luteola]AKU95972.1 hypothetical protein AKJ09_02636 [Labilithrix luteola]